MNYYDTHRLVKSEDLNHHGTLFAGRMSEWFVESCFLTAAIEYKHPENLVCLKLHDLSFYTPIRKGSVIKIQSKIINAGTTSITVYGKVTVCGEENTSVDGFLTFVCVDKDGKKMPHNLTIEQTEEDLKLLEKLKK